MTLLPIMGICLFSISAITLASPTANEYLPCHRQAAASLQACLDHSPGAENQGCWRESQQRNASCYREVKLSHAPALHREREAAARKATQERQDKQLRKESE